MKRLVLLTTLLLTLLSGLSITEPHTTRAQGTGPFAYIANSNDGTVSVIDTSNNSVVATVGVGANPMSVAVNPTGTRVYVTSLNNNSVFVIDTSNNTVIATVATEKAPIGVAVNPAGTRVYVANYWANSISVINTNTNSVVTTITVGTRPVGVAVNPNGTRIYVTNEGSANISVINSSTNNVVATIAVGDAPDGLVVNPTGTRVYVMNRTSNNISVIDPSNNTVVATIAVEVTPSGVAINPTGTRIYVTDPNSANIKVIDTNDNSVVATIAVGDYPYGVAVNPDGTRVYVTNVNDNTVSVIDTNTNSVVATVMVGIKPFSLGQFVGPVLAVPTPTATTPPTSTPTATKPPTNTPTATTISPTNTPGPTSGDSYESDNSCPAAKPITTDGLAQSHTFHVSGDEDWVKFEGTVSTTYLIDVSVSDSSTADVAMVMWDKCNGNATPNDSFNPEIHVQFKAPSNGTYFMHLTDNNDNGGAEVTYQLSVRTVAETASPGVLVLVAGKLRANDSLQTNIHNVTNNIYRLFTNQGYPPERITYLANDLNLNPDGDDLTKDVDNLARRDNLQLAISQAADKVGPDRAFTLYMMDHGNEDKFYLNGSNQTVAPDELSSWLDALEAAAPGVKVNVIIDACYSGSFIKGAKRLGKPGRVIIASTTDQTSAYASPAQGAIFSDSFLQGLGQKWSLYDSFMEGQLVARKWHPDQIAMIDSNGNGLPNEAADFSEAQRRGFAYAGTFSDEGQPPYIALANGPTQIKNGQGELQAVVKDDVTVGKLAVWAVIYKPSYVPPASSEELVADIENLPTIKLNGPDSNQMYRGLYEGFNESGTYRIVIYAVDEDGLQSRPREITLTIGGAKVYLPLIVK